MDGYHTPKAEKESEDDYYQRLCVERSFQNERFDEMWLEFSNYVVGPMPVDDFLQRFLRSGVPNLPIISYENLQTSSGLEEEYPKLYTEFIDAFQPICPDLIFKDTHSSPIGTFESLKIQPDICVFNKDIGENAICNSTKPEIMIIFKPFTNSENSSDNDDEDDSPYQTYFLEEIEARILGRVTAYAAAQHAAQFRTHLYSLLVLPKHAILFRWDRAGVVVTEPFPVSSPYLLEFLYLYNYATPHTRGIDLSVTIPSLKDASNARSTLGIATPTPLVQLSLGPSSSSYIISRETYMNCHCPFGRSTRGFVAYSVSCDAKVFLKDTWRLDSKTPEHRIYYQIHRNNVPHIPTVIFGGDILDHTTLTQDLIEEDLVWIRKPPVRIKKYRHYRLVLREVAAPLQSFTSTKVLVSAIRDAMEAHRVAYLAAGVLHHDISPNNIMIYNDGGLLLDWESSKSTHDKGARELERRGTWQFMSARLLKEPTALQVPLHYVESFVHVITWISFRYAGHNMDPEDLGDFMASIFDHSFRHHQSGFSKGGRIKSKYLTNPEELIETEFDNPNLQGLLKKITKIISIRYTKAPSPPPTDASELKKEYFELSQIVHADELVSLQEPMLMVSAFTSALLSPDWPTGDKAEENEIYSARTIDYTYRRTIIRI